MSTALDFLKAQERKGAVSRFAERARWRKENEGWLLWSRNIALALVDYMQTNGLSRSGLAKELGVSPQYVSRMLSGRVNFSFKSVYEIESKLGINCMTVGTGA